MEWPFGLGETIGLAIGDGSTLIVNVVLAVLVIGGILWFLGYLKP